MQLKIRHEFSLPLNGTIPHIVQLFRVYPGVVAHQTVIDWEISADCASRVRHNQDGYGNKLTTLYINTPLDKLELVIEGTVLTSDPVGIIRGTYEPLPAETYLQPTELTTLTPALYALADTATQGHPETLGQIHALNAHLHEILDFTPANIVCKPQTATEVLQSKKGCSAEYGHLLVALARAIGVPARIICGYIFDEPESNIGKPHNWCEVFIAEYGWIAFDPVNNICPSDNYIRVSVGLDYREASPVAISPILALESAEADEKEEQEAEVSESVGNGSSQIQSQS